MGLVPGLKQDPTGRGSGLTQPNERSKNYSSLLAASIFINVRCWENNASIKLRLLRHFGNRQDFLDVFIATLGFPASSDGKESACNVGDPGWMGKIPWRRERLPTPVFWPGEFHGLYSPRGRKESDPTERLSLPLSFTAKTACSVSDSLQPRET